MIQLCSTEISLIIFEQLLKNIDFLGGIEDTVGSKDLYTHLI